MYTGAYTQVWGWVRIRVHKRRQCNAGKKSVAGACAASIDQRKVSLVRMGWLHKAIYMSR